MKPQESETTAADRAFLPFPDRIALWAEIRSLMRDSPRTASAIHARARDIRKLNDEVDTFLQAQTAAVCPDCESVCCVNRHAFHDLADLVYLQALGEPMPLYDEDCDLSAPCQILGDGGCALPRHLRPHRCNWYFCQPLLRSMDERTSPASRAFSRRFQDLVNLRREMLDKFLFAARQAAVVLPAMR